MSYADTLPFRTDQTSPAPAPPPPVSPPPRATTQTGPTRRTTPLSWWLKRTQDLPPWLLVTQLFFGLGWLRAAAAKVISVNWWTGDHIVAFLARHSSETLTWAEPLVGLIVPIAPLVAALVLAAQLAIGSALVVNRHAPRALIAAMGLNIAFVAFGAVNPSAFYLVGQGAILLWMLGRRRPTPGLSTMLRVGTAAAVALAVVNIPLIATIDPVAVIDDPAMMMVTVGSLAAVAFEATHRMVFGRALP